MSNGDSATPAFQIFLPTSIYKKMAGREKIQALATTGLHSPPDAPAGGFVVGFVFVLRYRYRQLQATGNKQATQAVAEAEVSQRTVCV